MTRAVFRCPPLSAAPPEPPLVDPRDPATFVWTTTFRPRELQTAPPRTSVWLATGPRMRDEERDVVALAIYDLQVCYATACGDRFVWLERRDFAGPLVYDNAGAVVPPDALEGVLRVVADGPVSIAPEPARAWPPVPTREVRCDVCTAAFDVYARPLRAAPRDNMTRFLCGAGCAAGYAGARRGAAFVAAEERHLQDLLERRGARPRPSTGTWVRDPVDGGTRLGVYLLADREVVRWCEGDPLPAGVTLERA